MLDIGTELDIIDKSGAWYSYQGERLGQGRENAKQFLKEHEEMSEEIDHKIREAVGLITDENTDTEESDALFPAES